MWSIIPLNESIQQKKQLPNIDQSINEEPFHSEDLSDKTQSVKKEANKKEKVMVLLWNYFNFRYYRF